MMSGEWIERLVKSVNQITANGIAALAFIFGILLIFMVLVVLFK